VRAVDRLPGRRIRLIKADPLQISVDVEHQVRVALKEAPVRPNALEWTLLKPSRGS
jgi:hypothetical protein